MSTASGRLISYWKSQSLIIAPASSETGTQDFEFQNAVMLPSDVREYFLSVNGMAQIGGHDCDRNGFAFWPLARVKNVVNECAEHSMVVPEVTNPDKYFVFADYFQWSWAYAIYLGERSSEQNPVIHVGTRRHKVVASSFSEFVDLYLLDAKELYVDPQPQHSDL